MRANCVRCATAGPAARCMVTSALSAMMSAGTVRERDRRALLHLARQPFRVPVGQTHAAVGLRLADLARVGRAVDAVPLARELDPDRADGIVGSRADGEGGCRV